MAGALAWAGAASAATIAVALLGQAAPDGNGVFSNFYVYNDVRVALDDSVQVAFTAEVSAASLTWSPGHTASSSSSFATKGSRCWIR